MHWKSCFAWMLCLLMLGGGTVAGFHGIAEYYSPGARIRRLEHTRIRDTDFASAIPLGGPALVSQTFTATEKLLTRIEVRTVTWHQQPPDIPCAWSLRDVTESATAQTSIREGSFSMSGTKDWGYSAIEFEPIPGSDARTYELRLSAPSSPAPVSFGFPTYRSNAAGIRLTVENHSAPSSLPTDSPNTMNGCTLNLLLGYRR